MSPRCDGSSRSAEASPCSFRTSGPAAALGGGSAARGRRRPAVLAGGGYGGSGPQAGVGGVGAARERGGGGGVPARPGVSRGPAADSDGRRDARAGAAAGNRARGG